MCIIPSRALPIKEQGGQVELCIYSGQGNHVLIRATLLNSEDSNYIIKGGMEVLVINEIPVVLRLRGWMDRRQSLWNIPLCLQST